MQAYGLFIETQTLNNGRSAWSKTRFVSSKTYLYSRSSWNSNGALKTIDNVRNPQRAF